MRYYEENSTSQASIPENMSEDENDVEIESEDGDDDLDGNKQNRNNPNNQYYSQAEKRAHHNALERKRRDHIKDSFTSLRDSVPALQGEKASRAQILKKAAEYIQFMRRKNNAHQQDIDDLKRQNNLLEAQIRQLERAKATGNFAEASDIALALKSDDSRDSDTSDGEGDMGSMDGQNGVRRNKKLKTNSYAA
uniref:Protein max n=1 Tax=Corethrella appendiculata TaxID=1370023 RepID=U5EZT3_9DIPT